MTATARPSRGNLKHVRDCAESGAFAVPDVLRIRQSHSAREHASDLHN